MITTRAIKHTIGIFTDCCPFQFPLPGSEQPHYFLRKAQSGSKDHFFCFCCRKQLLRRDVKAWVHISTPVPGQGLTYQPCIQPAGSLRSAQLSPCESSEKLNWAAQPLDSHSTPVKIFSEFLNISQQPN